MPRGWKKKDQPAVQIPFELHYRRYDERECYRVWNSKWFDDQFESLTENKFEALQIICIKFNIPLYEQFERLSQKPGQSNGRAFSLPE